MTALEDEASTSSFVPDYLVAGADDMNFINNKEMSGGGAGGGGVGGCGSAAESFAAGGGRIHFSNSAGGGDDVSLRRKQDRDQVRPTWAVSPNRRLSAISFNPSSSRRTTSWS